MATKKTAKSTGKPKSNNSNSKANYNKNSPASSSREKKNQNRTANEKNKSQNNVMNRQRVAIVLFAVAVLLLAATVIKGQAIWLAFHNLLFGLFGVCAFAWPLILMYVAVIISIDESIVTYRWRIVGASAFVTFLSGIVHVFSQVAEISSLSDQIIQIWELRKNITIQSGGVIGALFGGIPNLLFGKAAALIVLFVLLIVVFMLLTGQTLVGFYLFFKKITQKHREKRVLKAELDNSTEEEYVGRNKKKPFVPIDVGPSAKDVYDDGMIIEELVGNAEKQDSKPNKKIPKSFTVNSETGEVVDETPAEIMDIINKTNEKEKAKKVNKTESIKQKNDEPVRLFHSYQKPTIDCLNFANNDKAMNYEDELKYNASKLVDTLNSFGVSTKIVGICRGPAVTRYELQPAAGVKISKITSLSDDIALALASSGVRIEAPIPNKSAVGVEVPNKNRATVSLREIIETSVYQNSKSKLNVALGKDITGNTICADIAKMPHLLIAGTTGSGKSVCLNSMIVSILYNASPDEVKLVMIDPKQVEFTIYNGIPHLLVPVVSDPRKAAGALGWAVTEMLQRYKMFSEHSVRDIKGFNKLCEIDDTLTPMPQIVIFIDELSDLMMAAPNEVEDSICRLAQMARAAGMHLVIATQRPSVNVITGIIKANIPSRIALSVSSQIDSRTILDMAGAEKLLGNGDMLFSPVGNSKPVRVQGCFLSDEEVENVVKFVKNQGEEKQYDEEIMQEIERQSVIENKKTSAVSSDSGDGDSSGDEMIPKAIEVVVEAQMASTTLLQRKLKLGYARAARIIDELEQRNIVGPFEGSKPRKVLISKQQWMEMNALANASAPIENPIETDAYDDYEEDSEE